MSSRKVSKKDPQEKDPEEKKKLEEVIHGNFICSSFFFHFLQHKNIRNTLCLGLVKKKKEEIRTQLLEQTVGSLSKQNE